MSRKSEPAIIESVFYNYTGTDEQFNTFLKSVIKDFFQKIICCLMMKILLIKSQHNSWILETSCDMLWLHRGGVTTTFR